jgi:hypothetical protein
MNPSTPNTHEPLDGMLIFIHFGNFPYHAPLQHPHWKSSPALVSNLGTKSLDMWDLKMGFLGYHDEYGIFFLPSP